MHTPLCAIGASAGGVEALQKFFASVADDLGLAFVVIVHLAPDQPSSLSDILAVRTKMPVHQVDRSARLNPNCVYVIPPDRELIIQGDDLTARRFTEPRGRRFPIDMFFRSIAAGRDDGIAVFLSGTGSDGSLGARAVKEAGGIVFAQDPHEAGYAAMPESAIATGAVDLVAPIAELAARIVQVIRTECLSPDNRRGIRTGRPPNHLFLAASDWARFFKLQTNYRLTPHCSPHAGDAAGKPWRLQSLSPGPFERSEGAVIGSLDFGHDVLSRSPSLRCFGEKRN